jgi:hypothetical protein
MSVRKEAQAERKRLAEIGWKVHRYTGSGHVALRNEDHPEWGIVVVASTPSDHRTLKNNRGEIARAMKISIAELEILLGVRQAKSNGGGRAKRRAASPRVQARRRQAEIRLRNRRPEVERNPDKVKAERRREYEREQSKTRLGGGHLQPTTGERVAALPTIKIERAQADGLVTRHKTVWKIAELGGVATSHDLGPRSRVGTINTLLSKMYSEGLIEPIGKRRRGKLTRWRLLARPALPEQTEKPEPVAPEKLPTKLVRSRGTGLASRRKAIAFIAERGQATTREIAEHLGHERTSTLHRLRRYREEGLIEWTAPPKHGAVTSWVAKAWPKQRAKQPLRQKRPAPVAEARTAKSLRAEVDRLRAAADRLEKLADDLGG